MVPKPPAKLCLPSSQILTTALLKIADILFFHFPNIFLWQSSGKIRINWFGNCCMMSDEETGNPNKYICLLCTSSNTVCVSWHFSFNWLSQDEWFIFTPFSHDDERNYRLQPKKKTQVTTGYQVSRTKSENTNLWKCQVNLKAYTDFQVGHQDHKINRINTK